jgi:hypothetical protein
MSVLEHLTQQWRALAAVRARRLIELKRLDRLLGKLGAAIEREKHNPIPTQLTPH